MASTLNPQYTPTQQAWRDAVAIVTLRAKDRMGAAYHGRLDKAQELVLNHAVDLNDDGHSATVQSESDDGKSYAVNGTCECRDAQTKAPEGWCKHKLAVAIYRRAVEHGQLLLVARTEKPAAPEPVTLPEAPVSVTLKGTVRGRTAALVTVRGTTLAEVEAQLDAAAALFDAAPVLKEEQPVCREVPSDLHRGADDPETAPYCDPHDTPYYKNRSKDGKHVWWSHRLADGSGFCRYKGKS